MNIIQLKRGQRWLWCNFDRFVVEIKEDKDIIKGEAHFVSATFVQTTSTDNSNNSIGRTQDFVFGSNQRYWTYLDGQDAPIS